jgi:hypothetical protein
MPKQTTSQDQPDTICLKKSHYKMAIPFLIFIAGIIVVYMVWGLGLTEVQAAQGNRYRTVVDPEPLANPIMVQDEHAPAMVSLAALYAPAEDKGGWVRLVCAGMSAGGCDYFKSNQADSMWESQTDHDASSGGFIESVKDINDTAQVWHAEVTVFAEGNQVTSDVFVLVERGVDDRWYLNRVLHGPGIQ